MSQFDKDEINRLTLKNNNLEKEIEELKKQLQNTKNVKRNKSFLKKMICD